MINKETYTKDEVIKLLADITSFCEKRESTTNYLSITHDEKGEEGLAKLFKGKSHMAKEICRHITNIVEKLEGGQENENK